MNLKKKGLTFFFKKIWILFEHNLKYISKNVLLFTQTFLGTFKLGRKVEPFRKDEGLFAQQLFIILLHIEVAAQILTISLFLFYTLRAFFSLTVIYTLNSELWFISLIFSIQQFLRKHLSLRKFFTYLSIHMPISIYLFQNCSISVRLCSNCFRYENIFVFLKSQQNKLI